jgi:hypothetical protein
VKKPSLRPAKVTVALARTATRRGSAREDR